MTTSYPTGYDAFTTIGSGDTTATSVGGKTHRAMHNDVNDSVEAIEAELGLAPSGSDATVTARLDAIEAGTRLATGSVTSAKILDGTIVAGDLADSAVTSAKILDGTIVNADVSNTAAIANAKTYTAPRTGLYTPGTAYCYASAPYAAGMAITGDIDVRWVGSLDDWTPAATAGLVSRFYNGPGTKNWALVILSSGSLQFYWTVDGTTLIAKTSTAAVSAADGAVMGIRATLDVDNGATGNDLKFYTSTDEGSTWTQLGSTVTTAGVTSIYNDAATILEVSGYSAGGSFNIIGRTLRAEVRSGIAGTVVASPDFRAGTIGKDGQGNVWTIYGATSKLTDDAANTVTTRGSYTSESVGRRIFTWDDYNLRWQMTYGDTGVRDLSLEALTNSWTISSNRFHLSRLGSIVTLHATFNGAAASAQAIYTLAAGFWPQAPLASSIPMSTTASTTRVLAISTAGLIEIYGYGTGAHYVTLTWRTNDAWPTALPGTASGSIPTA